MKRKKRKGREEMKRGKETFQIPGRAATRYIPMSLIR